MPVNDSKFSPESGKIASQIPTENISLDELESMHGGSESDQFQLLKKFGTKPGAYARLKISLLNNFINQEEYDALYSRVKDDSYWR
jgi:hypothetical protein